MAKTKFKHFDKSLFAFFKQLKKNNNRDWFNEHKDQYKEVVVEPMLDFIEAIAVPLNQVSRQFVAEPKANGGSLFRIYKDVRFSKDKKPYKENTACRFWHSAGRDVHGPGFYVHLEPGLVVFGGGIWLPEAKTLFAIRDRIRSRPKEWQKVVEDKALVKVFGCVDGEALKRPPRGFDADLKYIEDIKRKSFFAMRREPESIALNAKWINEVKKTFSAASPLLKFICKALDRPF